VRGFAMPVVVVLIAVFASVLGAALVTLSSAQHVGFGLDIQGVRAYHAARAGLEWGMYHVLRAGYGGCGGIDGVSLRFDGNLAGFYATVRCSESAHPEAGASVTLYAVTATGCSAAACPGSPSAGYVERELRAQLSK
jgi:MSHA biogenesis protein MshP